MKLFELNRTEDEVVFADHDDMEDSEFIVLFERKKEHFFGEDGDCIIGATSNWNVHTQKGLELSSPTSLFRTSESPSESVANHFIEKFILEMAEEKETHGS